jgi:hypothetical protein
LHQRAWGLLALLLKLQHELVEMLHALRVGRQVLQHGGVQKQGFHVGVASAASSTSTTTTSKAIANADVRATTAPSMHHFVATTPFLHAMRVAIDKATRQVAHSWKAEVRSVGV